MAELEHVRVVRAGVALEQGSQEQAVAQGRSEAVLEAAPGVAEHSGQAGKGIGAGSMRGSYPLLCPPSPSA